MGNDTFSQLDRQKWITAFHKKECENTVKEIKILLDRAIKRITDTKANHHTDADSLTELAKYLEDLKSNLTAYQNTQPQQLEHLVTIAKRTECYVYDILSLKYPPVGKEILPSEQQTRALKLYQDYTNDTLYKFETPYATEVANNIVIIITKIVLVGLLISVGGMLLSLAASTMLASIFLKACIGITILGGISIPIASILTSMIARKLTDENFLGTEQERSVDSELQHTASASLSLAQYSKRGHLNKATENVRGLANYTCTFFDIEPQPSFFAPRLSTLFGGGSPLTEETESLSSWSRKCLSRSA